MGKVIKGGGTRRAPFQTIHKWTGYWLHYYQCDMSDKRNTERRTDIVQTRNKNQGGTLRSYRGTITVKISGIEPP